MTRLALAATLLISSAALAQTQPSPDMPMPPAATGDSPATTGYKAAMEKMMAGMETPYTGDADRDFVDGMLPHHQGAIDMAQVELRYGTDPALRKLAHDIIVSQTEEQVTMRRWQLQHGPH